MLHLSFTSYLIDFRKKLIVIMDLGWDSVHSRTHCAACYSVVRKFAASFCS